MDIPINNDKKNSKNNSLPNPSKNSKESLNIADQKVEDNSSISYSPSKDYKEALEKEKKISKLK